MKSISILEADLCSGRDPLDALGSLICQFLSQKGFLLGSFVRHVGSEEKHHSRLA